MATFIVNPAIRITISAVNQKVYKLNYDYKKVSAEKIQGCKAALAYESKSLRVKDLVENYKGLIIKDMQDVSRYVEESIAKDRIIASKLR